MPGEPQSLKALFLEALEMPPEARARWLDQACRQDPARRELLEKMLAAHDTPQLLFDLAPARDDTGVASGRFLKYGKDRCSTVPRAKTAAIAPRARTAAAVAIARTEASEASVANAPPVACEASAANAPSVASAMTTPPPTHRPTAIRIPRPDRHPPPLASVS